MKIKINEKEKQLILNCLIQYIQEYDYEYTKDELKVIDNFIERLRNEKLGK